MRKLLELLRGTKPVLALPIQANADVAGGGQPSGRIESVTIGGGTNAATADDAVLAERKRIAAINAVASPEQAEMRDKFIADGTSALDAVLALNADAKSRPKAAAEPQITAAAIAAAIPMKEVAAEMLSMINAAAPASTPTIDQGDITAKTQLANIKDPKESVEFYAANRKELANTKINFNKEG